MIADGSIDFLVFFWDPLEPQAHDTDVKSLLRIAVVWNIPVACDRASADFMISSPLMTGSYERTIPTTRPQGPRTPQDRGDDRAEEQDWAEEPDWPKSPKEPTRPIGRKRPTERTRSSVARWPAPPVAPPMGP